MDAMAVTTAEQIRAERATSARVRGVDHLVFNTDDMAATIAFYCDVLGVRLVHAARTPRTVDKSGAGEPPIPYLRHYFFDMERSEDHTSDLQSLRHLVCRHRL